MEGQRHTAAGCAVAASRPVARSTRRTATPRARQHPSVDAAQQRDAPQRPLGLVVLCAQAEGGDEVVAAPRLDAVAGRLVDAKAPPVLGLRAGAQGCGVPSGTCCITSARGCQRRDAGPCRAQKRAAAGAGSWSAALGRLAVPARRSRTAPAAGGTASWAQSPPGGSPCRSWGPCGQGAEGGQGCTLVGQAPRAQQKRRRQAGSCPRAPRLPFKLSCLATAIPPAPSRHPPRAAVEVEAVDVHPL